MARFLNSIRKNVQAVGLVISVILIISVSITTVYATTYNGYFTAYAMGNQYSGAGVEISQGHFANHYYNWCPNDLSANSCTDATNYGVHWATYTGP